MTKISLFGSRSSDNPERLGLRDKAAIKFGNSPLGNLFVKLGAKRPDFIKGPLLPPARSSFERPVQKGAIMSDEVRELIKVSTPIPPGSVGQDYKTKQTRRDWRGPASKPYNDPDKSASYNDPDGDDNFDGSQSRF